MLGALQRPRQRRSLLLGLLFTLRLRLQPLRHYKCATALGDASNVSVPKYCDTGPWWHSRCNHLLCSVLDQSARICDRLLHLAEHFSGMRIGLRHTNLVSAACLLWQALIADCELWPSASSKECRDTYAGISSLLDSQLKLRSARNIPFRHILAVD